MFATLFATPPFGGDVCMCVVARSFRRSRGHSVVCLVPPLVFTFSVRGAGKGGEGAPANEEPPPQPSENVPLASALSPAGGCSLFHFTFISYRVAPFLVSGVTGPQPTPGRIISFGFCMQSLVSGIPWYQIFVSSHVHHLPRHIHPPGPPCGGRRVAFTLQADIP